MTRKLRVLAIAIVLCWSVAQAAPVPITVYPDPIQFGTVPLNSTSYPLTILLSNSSVDSVDVTAMTISGANSSDFAFYGPTCVGLIAGDQVCQMNLTFTPAAMGSLSANLVIAFKGTGSPLTIPLQGSGGNPIPSITSLAPASVYAGSAGLVLTINGANFLPSSVAFWDNSPLATTYVSSTQITAQVPASDLSGTQQAYIYVTNPSPGGGTSGEVEFQVIGLDPYVNGVSPISVVAGTGATQIILNGSNFMTGATVLWNGKPLSTTYINSSQLQAQFSKANVAKPEIGQLSVSNPAPGGLSSAVTFDVTYPAVVRILDIPANDLVWDPYAQRIYASVPSSYGANGNSIAVINPTNGSVGGYYYAGSEPTQLALSADAAYLYVGLNGNGSVQRLILPGFTPDINVSLGTSEYGGVNLAGDLEVSPGDSHTYAVSISGGCCGGGPLEFFTDTTLLPDSVSYPQISYMQFADATTLYGYSSGTVSQVSVNANGGTLTTQWNDLLTGNYGIHYDARLIYGNGGQVLNPQTGDLVGTYDVGGEYSSSNYVLPESAINSTFLLGTSPFFSSLGITSYDLSHFTPLAVINLSQLNGSSAMPIFINWGENGLAFVVEAGCCGSETYQLVIVQSSMMRPASRTKNPVPVADSLSPANAVHGGGNFQLTINGSGFVPSSETTWNGSNRTVSYVSSTQLIVYVPWSDIVSPGTASVVVNNPSPGGGKSRPLTFTIN
jgi:hypothetical protein